MKCKNCGSDLEIGVIYCPDCGFENHMVSEYNLIEDTEFQEMQQKEKELLKNQQLKEERLKHQQNLKKKKKKIVLILGIFAALIVASLIIFFAVSAHQKYNSFDYQYSEALKAYEANDFESAVGFADRASSLDTNNLDAWVLLARAQYKLGNIPDALDIMENVYAMSSPEYSDESPETALEFLILLYYENGDYDSIRSMAANDTDNISIYEQYLVNKPFFSVEGGNYDDVQELELSSSDSDLDIYYTLDDSEPDTDSYKYTEPIEIGDGKTIVTAVCADSEGHLSLPVTMIYEVTLTAPDAPLVTPESGTYSSAEPIFVDVPMGCNAYYAWDGKTPDENSARYSGPITMPEGNSILSVILIDKNGLSSRVTTRNYIYISQVEDETL